MSIAIFMDCGKHSSEIGAVQKLQKPSEAGVLAGYGEDDAILWLDSPFFIVNFVPTCYHKKVHWKVFG